MKEKRYYWLKLTNNFFRQKEIKRLRSISGGAVFVLIYQEMLLASIENEGFLFYENYYDTFAEELAAELDENVEDVKVVLNFLLKVDLIKEIDENTYLLTRGKEMIDSEASSTRRSRICRANKAAKAMIEAKSGNLALQCNTDATDTQQNCNTDIDIDIETEKELDLKENIIKEKNLKKSEIDEMFKKLWNEYPNPKGEEKAKRCFVYALKNGTTFEEIQNGIRDYSRYVKAKNIPEDLIKQGDNYFYEACWNNDYSAKPTDTKKKSSYDLEKVKRYAVPFETEEVSYDIDEFDKFAITHSSNTKKKE